MKTCFKCQQSKSLSDFYKHAGMADGHLGKCKECTKTDVRERRAVNIEHYKEYDHLRASLPHRVAARSEYQKTAAYAASHAKANGRYMMLHPERTKARHAVNNALRDGRLVAWPTCSMPGCSKKPQAHHPDYSRPLDVVWLCTTHHKAAHKI